VVAEQMLYEIGDPRRYLLPDVTCDFTQVRMVQQGEHRVRVSGARGLAPGPRYKVSATYADGFRCNAQLTIIGFDAARKARRTGEAILERTRELFAQRGLADYTRARIEVLGSEEAYFGVGARTLEVREAVLRIAVMHRDKSALELFAREIAPAGTSWSPGTTGAGDGRPTPGPAIKQYGFLVDKSLLDPVVVIGNTTMPVAIPCGQAEVPAPADQAARATHSTGAADDGVEIPLLKLAWARSGDKGNNSNIGVIARRPEWVALLESELTPARVKAWLAHLVEGDVSRYDVPGIGAFNFLCTRALDGGGMASLRNDPLGKGMAQVLLAMPIRVPRAFAELAN
jgi:hypothetical protein